MRHNSFRTVSLPFPRVTDGYHLDMRLKEYRRKRRSGSGPNFVVQQEAGGSDHYDLLLEIDGVLASWTISTDRRMARRAEDRPLEYAESDVIVTDSGTYANATQFDMAECLERGYLSFQLRGEKLRGCYTLTRIREGTEETWLLIKRKDEDAHTPGKPALTGHTLDDSS